MGGDHARPLNARGQGDAAALGAWMQATGLAPQRVLCSSATRTQQTLAALAMAAPVEVTDTLYLASAGDMLARIQATPDEITDLMLIGHNPGIHGLLALLVGEYAHEADVDRLILKFPTSATAVLTVKAAHWVDVMPQCARLETLRY